MTHQTRAIGLIRERSAELHHLSEARQDARRLLDEITQEESRLKAIGAILAKIEQEVDALYENAPATVARGIHSTELRNTFNVIDDDFSALQKHCSELIQFQNKIAGLGSEHAENLRRVEDWFSKIERDLDEVERGPDADVEKKLVILEGLNQEVVNGNVHIDHADQASRRLLGALDGLSAHPDASKRHEAESEERRRRHSKLVDRMQQAFNQATAQKAANEGVRDAVHDLCSWIEDFESRSCTNRDIPLIEEELNQLKRDEQMLRMDLDSRLSLTNDLENDLKKLAGSNPPEWVEATEQKLKDAALRLQRNSTELRGFRDNVNDALEGVIALDAFGVALDRSCDATSAILRSMSARDDQGLNEIASELAALDSQLTDMMRTAETIKKIPNVTKTQAVDQLIRNADEKLHVLNKELTAKYSTQEEVGRLESDFENAKQRMADWISQFDAELLELKPVSIDHDKLSEQRKDQLALVEKHKEGLNLLEDLEAVSMRLTEAERETGSNRLSVTPRITMELVAKYNAQAEALRSRLERINAADQKAIELQTTENELSAWISSQMKSLSEHDVPTSIDSVNALLAALDRMSKAKRQEQRRLDDIRLRGRELAADARLAGEGEQLLERHRALSEKWDQLTDLMEAARERASVAEKWIEGHAALEKWLGAKRRMLLAIGAPTTDAAIARTQMGQIQLINAEMDGERASYKKLKAMLESLPESSSNGGLAALMNELSSGLASFEKELADKERNVQRASDLGSEIKSMQKAVMSVDFLFCCFEKRAVLSAELIFRFRNDVAVLESDIEKFGALLPSEVEARLSELSALKSQLVDLSEQVDHMSHLVEPSNDLEIDPMNKGDLDEQMSNMKKKIDEMSRKLDQLKNIALSSRSEGDEIEKKLEVLLDVAREARSEIEEAPPISAERNRLQEHMDSINALLVKVNDLEGDFPYVRAMVTERLKKVPDDDLQMKMQYLASNWNPTVTNVKDKKAMIAKVSAFENTLL
ncbi:spectrin repeat-containing domain protein [Cooperia oncophora]